MPDGRVVVCVDNTRIINTVINMVIHIVINNNMT